VRTQEAHSRLKARAYTTGSINRPTSKLPCTKMDSFLQNGLPYPTGPLSACPVCNVGVLWPNGWMDHDETWRGGRPRPRPHCVRWEPSSPKRAQPTNFWPMSVMAKWMDGLRCHAWYGGKPRSRRDFVLDGEAAPLKGGTAPNFRPMSIVAKRLHESRCHLVPVRR